jgi:NAD(P)H dehydrogenase (quinone)
MSTEALNGAEAAAILSEVLEQKIHCDYKQPEDLRELLMSSEIPVEPNYAEAGAEFMRQVMDGRMGYIGSVRDDVQFITGKPSTSFKQWAIENCDRLLPKK